MVLPEKCVTGNAVPETWVHPIVFDIFISSRTLTGNAQLERSGTVTGASNSSLEMEKIDSGRIALLSGRGTLPMSGVRS